MNTDTRLAEELERRLTHIETVEADDPVHARLGGGSLALFLSVVGVIALGSWIAGVL
ncbi:hypothetical protein [Leucobacter manosquensis]|uniref:DUF3040 domain-containing protein n=1 Tax=Leucobacter manosquensis TaxID=2810611 RepID=A0ABS5M456_9MICO|nr:hypothetical protein [Leucobacter manosquensis]MBS3181979.1 hypothetical protein [Leucobacter manosquensis]